MAPVELQGRALLLTVSAMTSLGFMLIGYDNGLMGGLVNGPAFNATFDSPDADLIGTIVAIYESMSYALLYIMKPVTYSNHSTQLAASLVPCLPHSSARSLAVDDPSSLGLLLW
jgi:hypothetical protein